MEHHDDIGVPLQRPVVGGLLVAAIAEVLAMDDDLQAEPPGDLDRLVAGHVVDEDDVVDQVVRDVRIRALERLRGVVGGHHDDDAGPFGDRLRGAWSHAARIANGRSANSAESGHTLGD